MASDDDLVTGRGYRIPAAAIRWWASRSGGPGGQHANTSDTQVTVEVDLDLAALSSAVDARVRKALGPTVRATASDSRSQFRNRTLARQRVAAAIDDAARPPAPRRTTRPTRGSVERRLTAKRQRAERKRERRWNAED